MGFSGHQYGQDTVRSIILYPRQRSFTQHILCVAAYSCAYKKLYSAAHAPYKPLNAIIAKTR